MPAIFPTTEPNISLRVLPKIPATLQGAGGIEIVKLNGIWTIRPSASLPSILGGNIPTVSGPPAFVPSVLPGTVPSVYDTTNNRLYVYNGAWKSVALT